MLFQFTFFIFIYFLFLLVIWFSGYPFIEIIVFFTFAWFTRFSYFASLLYFTLLILCASSMVCLSATYQSSFLLNFPFLFYSIYFQVHDYGDHNTYLSRRVWLVCKVQKSFNHLKSHIFYRYPSFSFFLSKRPSTKIQLSQICCLLTGFLRSMLWNITVVQSYSFPIIKNVRVKGFVFSENI